MALIAMSPGNAEAAIEAAALRSDRFRQEREPDWKRLELIVTRMEKGRLGKLSDADLLELPVLYRTVASSLSVARETSLDAATLAYLDSLVQRAWFLVYGPRTTLWSWLRRFFGGEWSRAVRAIAPEILVALALMVAGTVVGWMLCAQDPDWYYAFVSPDLAGERVPGATREVLREGLFGKANEDGLSVFAASLFSHNSSVSILMYALGFAFGVPTLMLVVQNTTMLGAILWLYHGVGLDYEIAGWLAIHGTTELFALLLAGAAGLHVGRSMAFPGALSVAEAAAAAGQRTATVMAGVVLMLLCAGMLEGLGRQLVDVTATRLTIGAGMLVFWLAYFFLFRHVPQGSEE
ncbi:MAG: stage II sporulation protein M [Novosphingobium sp.]